MTHPQDRAQDPAQDVGWDPTQGLLAVLDEAAARVRRAAFTRLLATAAPVDVATLSADAGLSEPEVETALSDLADTGAITRQANSAGDRGLGGPVVAAGGLAVAPARHQLLLAGQVFWTWCAFDGIGIPAALGVDAVLDTRCPACGQPIRVTITGGQPPAVTPLVGWLPGRACANVQDDFCPEANLFCTDAHLASWRATAGEPQGTAGTLAELAETGRRVWVDLTR